MEPLQKSVQKDIEQALLLGEMKSILNSNRMKASTIGLAGLALVSQIPAISHIIAEKFNFMDLSKISLDLIK